MAESILEVAVTALDSRAGVVRFALFDSPAGFADSPAWAVVREAASQESDGTLVWRVAVPRGRYAVAAIHDRNVNGELDTNFLGMPTEPYGFSNDARGSFGPPDFGDAAFDVRAPRVRVSFVLR